jgi:site-specific recombinase XerD
MRAAVDFLAWCAHAGVAVDHGRAAAARGAWIELQTQTDSALTVKQRLAAIRHLFDWLVTGQIVPHNPAASVHGPAHSTKKWQDAGARCHRSAVASRQYRRDDARRAA